MAGVLVRQEPRRIRPALPFGSGPFGSLFPLRGDLEEFFSRFWGDEGNGSLSTLATSMDVAETEKSVEVRLDVPGVQAKDIDIQIDGGVLTIRGERSEKEEEEDKKRNYHRVERRYGSFARSVTLPCNVREDEAAADYKDGVLTIVLPKAEESQARKIKVKG
jgi:HSP20 family protein